MMFRTKSEKAFNVFNYTFVILVCLACFIPILHILAVSFSAPHYVTANVVTIWPRGFTAEAYVFAFETGLFMRAFWVSVHRTVLGVAINMFLMVTVAYPLSKSSAKFSARHIYMGFFALTMLFGGGIIPFFILISDLGLLNSMWSLVLPGGLPVFSMLILMNFIRNLPAELEEAALIDGAGYMTVLFKILLPVLKPALATVALFAIVFHWNEWLTGMMFMQPENYPLQTYLQALLANFQALMRQVGADPRQMIGRLNEQTGRSSQLFLAMLPVLVVYPFLQKYFAKGLVIGSVKG